MFQNSLVILAIHVDMEGLGPWKQRGRTTTTNVSKSPPTEDVNPNVVSLMEDANPNVEPDCESSQMDDANPDLVPPMEDADPDVECRSSQIVIYNVHPLHQFANDDIGYASPARPEQIESMNDDLEEQAFSFRGLTSSSSLPSSPIPSSIRRF
ncbi:hypothetical protein R3W88_032758 [Solanum pinnatisectum]|uniref:Uncharacterized protein n=1 Tax=Solanum pinnatisectum TaxID=50273 RepID=A0AAV9LQ33_9SOLN|nr:hypothetical protein R3W88_032758 [Solanum pinnatisectum]